MTHVPILTVPSAPDYAKVLADMLLEDGMLVVLDAGSGTVVHANQTAIFLLELSEDSLGDYSFAQVCAPAEGGGG